jgi:competence protein ComEC
MKRLIILVVILLANLFIWSAVFSSGPRDFARVVFLDVGQGDAIFIEAPNGNQMLIDGGRDQKVLSELRHFMPWFDREIDVVLATHPDADHIGGLTSVIDRYKVNVFLETENESETAIYKLLDSLLDEHISHQVKARAGQIIWLDKDMYFIVLFPDRGVENMEANTASIVGKLVYGDSEVMLTGDSPKSIENYLVGQYGEFLDSDILKAGHHGSKTSTAQAFLSVVSPKEVVISAEKNSRYGHPHKEVVDSIKNFGAKLRSTAEEGSVEYILYSTGL